MASFVYSTQFLHGHGSGVSAVYTVPANSLVVIRSIALSNVGSGVASGYCFEEAGAVVLAQVGSIAALQTTVFQGRWVIIPGQRFDVHVTAGTLAWNVSGYLLSTL